jgi:cell volume regulation protein A
LASRFATRTCVPLALLFLIIGKFSESDGFGSINFSDYELAFRVGTVALILILFDGGSNATVLN